MLEGLRSPEPGLGLDSKSEGPGAYSDRASSQQKEGKEEAGAAQAI